MKLTLAQTCFLLFFLLNVVSVFGQSETEETEYYSPDEVFILEVFEEAYWDSKTEEVLYFPAGYRLEHMGDSDYRSSPIAYVCFQDVLPQAEKNSEYWKVEGGSISLPKSLFLGNYSTTNRYAFRPKGKAAERGVNFSKHPKLKAKNEAEIKAFLKQFWAVHKSLEKGKERYSLLAHHSYTVDLREGQNTLYIPVLPVQTMREAIRGKLPTYVDYSEQEVLTQEEFLSRLAANTFSKAELEMGFGASSEEWDTDEKSKTYSREEFFKILNIPFFEPQKEVLKPKKEEYSGDYYELEALRTLKLYKEVYWDKQKKEVIYLPAGYTMNVGGEYRLNGLSKDLMYVQFKDILPHIENNIKDWELPNQKLNTIQHLMVGGYFSLVERWAVTPTHEKGIYVLDACSDISSTLQPTRAEEIKEAIEIMYSLWNEYEMSSEASSKGVFLPELSAIKKLEELFKKERLEAYWPFQSEVADNFSLQHVPQKASKAKVKKLLKQFWEVQQSLYKGEERYELLTAFSYNLNLENPNNKQYHLLLPKQTLRAILEGRVTAYSNYEQPKPLTKQEVLELLELEEESGGLSAEELEMGLGSGVSWSSAEKDSKEKDYETYLKWLGVLNYSPSPAPPKQTSQVIRFDVGPYSQEMDRAYRFLKVKRPKIDADDWGGEWGSSEGDEKGWYDDELEFTTEPDAEDDLLFDTSIPADKAALKALYLHGEKALRIPKGYNAKITYHANPYYGYQKWLMLNVNFYHDEQTKMLYAMPDFVVMKAMNKEEKNMDILIELADLLSYADKDAKAFPYINLQNARYRTHIPNALLMGHWAGFLHGLYPAQEGDKPYDVIGKNTDQINPETHQDILERCIKGSIPQYASAISSSELTSQGNALRDVLLQQNRPYLAALASYFQPIKARLPLNQLKAKQEVYRMLYPQRERLFKKLGHGVYILPFAGKSNAPLFYEKHYLPNSILHPFLQAAVNGHVKALKIGGETYSHEELFQFITGATVEYTPQSP